MHQYLTPLKQQEGKLLSVFVQSLLHAPTVRFQPHPGTLKRLFGFEISVLGLSILLLRHLALNLEWNGIMLQLQHAKLLWIGISTKALRGIIVGIVADSVCNLVRYTRVYLVEPVEGILNVMLDLLLERDKWHAWNVDDLPQLVLWINSTWEEFHAH